MNLICQMTVNQHAIHSDKRKRVSTKYPLISSIHVQGLHCRDDLLKTKPQYNEEPHAHGTIENCLSSHLEMMSVSLFFFR